MSSSMFHTFYTLFTTIIHTPRKTSQQQVTQHFLQSAREQMQDACKGHHQQLSVCTVTEAARRPVAVAVSVIVPAPPPADARTAPVGLSTASACPRYVVRC